MTGYPGNKSAWQVPAINAPIIHDLFMGGGGWSRAALRANPRARVVGAEINPIQRAILRGDGLDESMQLAIGIAGLLRDCIPNSWDGTGKFAEQFPEARARLGEVWRQWVKAPFDAGYRGDVDHAAMVAQICVSSFGYGANIRSSGNGLNVPPNPQKIRRGVPICPQRVPNLAAVYPDFRQMPPIANGIALIDPPYWLPKRYSRTHQRLTACYPGHKPYSSETYQLYADALQLAKSADLILITNYFSDEMDQLVRSLGLHTQTITHGVLQSQGRHRHRLTHGGRSHPNNLPSPVEVEWICSRNPLRIDLPEQLSLLEV